MTEGNAVTRAMKIAKRSSRDVQLRPVVTVVPWRREARLSCVCLVHE
jgi:hypothetical protein